MKKKKKKRGGGGECGAQKTARTKRNREFFRVLTKQRHVNDDGYFQKSNRQNGPIFKK